MNVITSPMIQDEKAIRAAIENNLIAHQDLNLATFSISVDRIAQGIYWRLRDMDMLRVVDEVVDGQEPR